MHLDAILLGLLQTPATGYQIKQSFDTIFTHIWAAELSQIYRTLKRLERSGALKSRAEPSAKGPEQRKYEITAKGRRLLHRWLAEGPSLGDERYAHVAQLFFLGELRDFRITERFLETLLVKYEERLATLQRIEAGWRSADPRYPDRLDPKAFHSALTLQMGIQRIDALARWARDSIERVRKRRKEEH